VQAALERSDDKMTEGPSHEENLALVAQANAAGQLVPPTRVRAACPERGEQDVIDVWQVMRLQRPGAFSLAGAQTKAPGRIVRVYRCSACGAAGDAAPK
jgi:hypothetical protein